MTLGNGLYNRQTKTGSRTTTTSIKAVEDALAFLRRNARSIVGHLNVGQTTITSVTDINTPTVRDVMQRIGNQIGEQDV